MNLSAGIDQASFRSQRDHNGSGTELEQPSRAPGDVDAAESRDPASTKASTRLGVMTSAAESNSRTSSGGSGGRGRVKHNRHARGSASRHRPDGGRNGNLQAHQQHIAVAEHRAGSRSMSSGESFWLAPGATPIMFSPSLLTNIKATPEAESPRQPGHGRR